MGKLYFIDEGNRFVSSQRFAEMVRIRGNYFVIVTRENLYSLPYSVTEIYGIHSAGKYNSMQKVYHEFYRIYGEENGFDPENVNEIITEDSNSGYQFFRAVCRRDISCRSAAENSNVLGAVEKSNRSEILVIADGRRSARIWGSWILIREDIIMSTCFFRNRLNG